MTFYGFLLESLATLAVIGVPLALMLSLALGRVQVRERIRQSPNLSTAALGFAWLVATSAMLGSLYLSEVVGFPPCVLCWYQRIAMYPLVVLLGGWLGSALGRGSLPWKGLWRLVMPLPVIGLVIALYHTFIQLQPAANVVSCSEGAPCSVRHVAVFGFVSIPVLSAAAFVMIIVSLAVVAVHERSE
jgi:disulfide bond formation protein DsbB